MIEQQERDPAEGHPIEDRPERPAPSAGPPAVVDTPPTANQRHLDLKRILGVTSGISALRRPAT